MSHNTRSKKQEGEKGDQGDNIDKHLKAVEEAAAKGAQEVLAETDMRAWMTTLLTTFEKGIESVKMDLVKKIDNVQLDMGSVKMDMGNIQSEMGNVNTKIDNVQSNIENVQSDMEGVYNRFDRFQMTINNRFDDCIKQQETYNHEFKMKIEGFEERLTANNESLIDQVNTKLNETWYQWERQYENKMEECQIEIRQQLQQQVEETDEKIKEIQFEQRRHPDK